MKIELELEDHEVQELYDWMRENTTGGTLRNALAEDLANACENAIHNEAERQYDLHQERLMEEGGNPARERHIREYEEKYR